MSGMHMNEAKEQGADFMVTPCPLCHMSLDIYQERAGQAMNREFHLPILHVPQLLGLAMGLPAKDLGLSHHVISVDSILEKLERRRTNPQPS
jgi:succinate dehydrogenase / fumarate reductase, cytochrome b subunit